VYLETVLSSLQSHDTGETWSVLSALHVLLLPAKNKIDIKSLCIAAGCLQSQYLQRTLKFCADKCFMKL